MAYMFYDLKLMFFSILSKGLSIFLLLICMLLRIGIPYLLNFLMNNYMTKLNLNFSTLFFSMPYFTNKQSIRNKKLGVSTEVGGRNLVF
jgi:hypothetical protein